MHGETITKSLLFDLSAVREVAGHRHAPAALPWGQRRGTYCSGG